MKKMKILSVIFMVLACFSVGNSQEVITVSLGPNNKQLNVSLNPLQAIDRSQRILLSDIKNYRLYKIEDADEPDKMRGVEQSIFSGAINCDADCARVEIPLIASLDYEKVYMLKINGLSLDDKAIRPIRFEVKKEAVILPSFENSRGVVRVKSTVPLEPSGNNILIKETILKVSDKGDKLITDIKPNSGEVISINKATNEIVLKLDKRLSENSTHDLSINNELTDGNKNAIKAEGKIKIAGLPSAPNSSPIDIKVSTLIATGEKPYFDLVTSIKLPRPWNIDGDGKWYIEPTLTADVGLGKTKTKNSIIFSFLFKRDLSINGNEVLNPNQISDVLKKEGEVAKLPAYYGWRKTPATRLTSIEFRIGPKIETDRRFARLNTIGSIRFDFHFSRWQASIDEKREYLARDIKDKASQVALRKGFRLVPYINFDFGRKVTTEVVENKGKGLRILVPQYAIARGQFGFVNLYEWYIGSFPMTLTIEEGLQYLFKEERIATEVDEGIDVRNIRGFQHQGKASIDFFLDRAKRYSFNITYENGRWAPNFEYLNKVSTGFRLQY